MHIYRYYLIGILLLLGITAFSQFFHLQLGLINIALMHLIPIIVVALRGNLTATMVITALSVFLFDVLYVPPQYSINVHDLFYIWSFIIFFIVGYTITLQAKRIHANEIKEILLNTLSHDLKTPLSSILGSASLLIDEETIDSDTRKLLAKQIRDSGQRMDRLIGNLLDSARLQNSNSVLKNDWCDIEDILGVTLQEFRDHPRYNYLKVQLLSSPPLFWGDSALLVRLVVNLLDNALKYSKDDKDIEIVVKSTIKNIYITICNERAPLSQEDLANMFDRFYRLEQNADIKGSGIGLSICKEIVEAHHGAIRAYNGQKGICIEVKLPVIKHAGSKEEVQ